MSTQKPNDENPMYKFILRFEEAVFETQTTWTPIRERARLKGDALLLVNHKRSDVNSENQW
eukprot:9494194-Pyramimonas_sp.AAC.1